ncbi:MAG: DUF6150 family protein [Bacteroidales bacterium]|nr:DUF6150 family protein [Bacteroidales bacterium]
MKKLFSFLLILFVGFSVYAAEPDSLLLASNSSSEPIDKEHCTCKGKTIQGLVRIVEYGADFKVCIVDAGADLDVRVNKSYTVNDCGNWTFVGQSYTPDFTIQFVNDCWEADFTIRYIDY